MRDAVPGRSLAETLLQREIVMQRAPDSREVFDPSVCQCCEYKRHSPNDPDCVCDGLPWKLYADGHVRCSAHLAADAIDGRKKKHWWSR